jgi:hypothetical protein
MFNNPTTTKRRSPLHRCFGHLHEEQSWATRNYDALSSKVWYLGVNSF